MRMWGQSAPYAPFLHRYVYYGVMSAALPLRDTIFPLESPMRVRGWVRRYHLGADSEGGPVRVGSGRIGRLKLLGAFWARSRGVAEERRPNVRQFEGNPAWIA